MDTKKENDELAPSKLGTLDYWESAYSTEIENYESHGDVGEIWFGNQSSRKAVRHIEDKLKLSKDNDRIIDIGCGNGMSLVDLSDAGFKKLCGVDYSQKAIDLAKKVLDEKGHCHVELLQFDIVEADPTGASIGSFKLAHDKGTYDAISLCPDGPKAKRRKYIKNVHAIIEDAGFFFITSCNWTKAELIEHFKEYFEFLHEIPTKTFSFGGQAGNTITQLVFVKK